MASNPDSGWWRMARVPLIPAPAPSYLTHSFTLVFTLVLCHLHKADNGRPSVYVSYLKLYLADDQKSSFVGLDFYGGIAVAS